MKTLPVLATGWITYAILSGFGLASSVAAEEAHWKPAAKVDLAIVAEKTAERAKIDKSFVRQPTILAFRTALYLAGGSFDTPTRGRIQSIKAAYKGGEEAFKTATVIVEFMGYADDSLIGERFTLQLSVDATGVWKIDDAERAAYGRGDHK